MSIEIKVPQLPESVSDATLVAWHKKAGDNVARDENLVDLETDKVVLEVPAPSSGVLKEVRVEQGSTVTEGDVLAVLEEGESAPAGGDETVRAAVADLMQRGADLEDAVLTQIHGAMSGNPRMADEFAAYFMLDLMKMGRQSMSSSSRLRRFLDTGDLVVSVFGDLWSDLATLRFESRHQFKTLFSQRMRWIQ